MPKFTYNGIVCAPAAIGGNAIEYRKAWVVGIFEIDKEPGSYWKKFPAGVVYTVEFEDGSSTEFHENDLRAWEKG
ncbi:MAG TPA: hypothetical protein VMA74_02475 [Dyella sp.]|uniref:hypothetical protein n=1 Tax=Dyella sp. TaxID=1869338 RepID=UPI002CA3F95E|nr:hypothetical protein [Dyella sp.]HUB88574.1 hypothetical protein [Dyella sp.]